MTKTMLSLSTAAALALATLETAPVSAAEPASVYGAKTVGAMTFETLGRATNSAQVLRQGGFATAGTAQWIRTPTAQVTTATHAF